MFCPAAVFIRHVVGCNSVLVRLIPIRTLYVAFFRKATYVSGTFKIDVIVYRSRIIIHPRFRLRLLHYFWRLVRLDPLILCILASSIPKWRTFRLFSPIVSSGSSLVLPLQIFYNPCHKQCFFCTKGFARTHFNSIFSMVNKLTNYFSPCPWNYGCALASTASS